MPGFFYRFILVFSRFLEIDIRLWLLLNDFMSIPTSKLTIFLKLLFVCVFLSVQVVYADQKDPRLEDLFSTLKETEDTFQGALIENSIWQIWTEHEDSRANGLMIRGIQQINANSLYGALDTYDQLIALQPDFAEAWNKRATIHYLMGNYAASLRDIEEVLKLEPFHFGAISGRGLVYMSRGEYFQARSAFLNLLEIYPAMPGVRDNIQMLEQMLKESVI